ncbi:MAG: DUF2997 domain-containing protein [Candidatus Bathyarchaeia archaeon]
MKRLVIVFREDGTVSVDAEGFQGSECVDLTDKLLKPLNAKVESRVLKGEFYVKTKQESRARVQG